jgi:O-antigen/teichoic acid export membrane protein
VAGVNRGIAFLGLHTFASQVLVYTSGFVSSVFIARALGPEGRGLYAVGITLVTITAALASQGLDLAQVRLWARASVPRASLVTASSWLAVLVGGLVGSLALVVYEAGRSGAFEGVPSLGLLLLVGLMPMWAHSALMRGVLVMDGAVTTVNRALVAGDLCRTAAVVVLYLTDRLTVGNVLALFGVTIVVPWAIIVRRVGLRRLERRPPLGLMLEQVGLGAKLAPYSLFLMLNLRIDVLLVAYFAKPEQVGLYSIAVLIAELVWLPTWALAQPVKERQANAEHGAAVAVTAHAVRMTLLVAALFALCLAVLAPGGVAVIFGSGFAPAVSAVWALLPASVAMAAWRVVAPGLVRLDAGLAMPAIALAALALNMGANALLIPALGIVGAGLVSTASYGCGALLALMRFCRAGDVALGDLLPGRRELAELVATLRPASLRRQLAWLRMGEAGF